MAMNFKDALTYLPAVCISILLAIAVTAEILTRKGILHTGNSAITAGGYLYAAYDRTGGTYRFRIAGTPRNGYHIYLEDAPAHVNTTALRVDAKGRHYIPVHPGSSMEAEQEAERFAQQQ